MTQVNEPNETHQKLGNWLVVHRLPKNYTKIQMQKVDVRYRLHVKILTHLIIAASKAIKQCKIYT